MKSSFKIFAALIAMAALAACDTNSTGTGATSGMGGTAGTGEFPNATAGSNEDLVSNIGDRVFFAYDSSTLDGESQSTLARQAAWLQQHSGVNVTVEGHCDERGTREYNIALGERRAYAAKKFLVSQGVNPSRISTVSYGKERPAVVGSDEASWAQNRRAVTVVVQ